MSLKTKGFRFVLKGMEQKFQTFWQALLMCVFIAKAAATREKEVTKHILYINLY